MNLDASHDASFANIFPNNGITALTLQADEAILVAGDFTQIGATPRSFLARLIASNVLAVGNQRQAAATQAWPNPVHDYLHLALDVAAQPRRVTLCDVTGRTVLIRQLVPQASLTLQVQDLPAGIYLLRVDYASGPVTRRVVIE